MFECGRKRRSSRDLTVPNEISEPTQGRIIGIYSTIRLLYLQNGLSMILIRMHADSSYSRSISLYISIKTVEMLKFRDELYLFWCAREDNLIVFGKVTKDAGCRAEQSWRSQQSSRCLAVGMVSVVDIGALLEMDTSMGNGTARQSGRTQASRQTKRTGSCLLSVNFAGQR